MDLAAFKAMTFDCYGTLIDWESGILRAIRPVLDAHRVHADDAEILALYAELEHAAQQGEYRPYRTILQSVMAGFRDRYGVEFNSDELSRLAASVESWQAFPDTHSALHQLHRHYKLVVISNIDDDLFALSRPKLGVDLDGVVTAQFVHSYKPQPKHFRAALALLDLPPHQVLHVAESRYHDIAPAKAMGFGTVWVNRHAASPHATASEGRTPEGIDIGLIDSAPDLEVADLATLARLALGADRR